LRDERADKQLIEMLTEYGTVVSASLITTYDGKGKGFGFVSFETTENAEECMNDINGCEILVYQRINDTLHLCTIKILLLHMLASV